MLKTHRPLTVLALMLSMFMGAMEMTVVSTAMPTVVADLGGLHLYSWVFAAYLLSATVSVPIYGKLADLFGRKPVLLFGIALFLVGSIASGFAPTMTALIVFRALQGLGAGAMQPLALTIVGDLFTIEERGRMQGLFGAMWGLAGIAGPVLGGYIVKWLSWHWVFWVNVPIGLASMAVLWIALHENVEKQRRSLDLPGAALFTVGIVSLLAATHGGAFAWPSLAVSAVSLLLFVKVEARAPEPLLPLDLFRQRVIAVASLTGALVGGAMLGLVTFVPLHVQGVLGGSPTEAGSAIAPMVVGWPIASAVSGRLIGRVGFRPLIQGGLFVSAASAFALALLIGPGTSLLLPQVTSTLFGVGLGLANTALIVAIQSAVDWNRRGVATASAMFFRNIGGPIAVGVLGAIIASALARDPSIPAQAADQLLGPDHGRTLAPTVMQSLSGALSGGLGVAFWIIFATALAAFFASLLLPRMARTEGARGELSTVAVVEP